MSCDKLVFDLSQEVEGSPNVFIRKDWLNILDNQNQNYQSNQSIIDTSQLSNSNKYMSYREAYLSIPITLNMVTTAQGAGFAIPLDRQDFCIGLKNWFGSVIHSFTLDYNGTTIIQQTPFINMWNAFKLMTTLSWNDVETQGATIGFYPDTSASWVFTDANSVNGIGTCNNVNENLLVYGASQSGSSIGDAYLAATGNGGNIGLQRRIKNINFNPNNFVLPTGALATYGTRGIAANSCNQVWKSYISQQLRPNNAPGLKQIAVVATVYLKHVHSFFNMVPLLKGAFMKMTMNLNNSDTTVQTTNAGVLSLVQSTVPVGGVQCLMVPSINGGLPAASFSAPAGANAGFGLLYYSLSIGARNLSQTVATAYLGVGAIPPAPLSQSVYLYVPAYTFNPTFEEAYLSSPIKQVKYTDIYQYQVLGINTLSPFNNLITNGIANIKSVLIIPFYSSQDATVAGTGLGVNNPVYQSPFDPAGTGCTSPMITLGNFNVQISGQNAIYNMQRYTFEQFNNQLYGQNAVNGGLTDGLTSALIDYNAFQNSHCYYYVNVERMLPVEQSVPKSVQIIGQNYSTQKIDLWVFIEYGVEVSIDILTGARV